MLSLALWLGFALIIIGLVILLSGIFYTPPPTVTVDGTPPDRKLWEKLLDYVLKLIDKLLDPNTPTKSKLQIAGVLVMAIGVALLLGALKLGAKSDLDDEPTPTPSASAPASTAQVP